MHPIHDNFLCDFCGCAYEGTFESDMDYVCKRCFKTCVERIKEKVQELASETTKEYFIWVLNFESCDFVERVERQSSEEIDRIVRELDMEQGTYDMHLKVWKHIFENGAWEIETEGYVCE